MITNFSNLFLNRKMTFYFFVYPVFFREDISGAGSQIDWPKSDNSRVRG